MMPFSQEVLTLFRILDGSEWHDYREVIEQLAITMAPGKALRRYDDRREGRRLRGEVTKVDIALSDDEKILYGQRLLASVAINGVKRRYLDIEYVDVIIDDVPVKVRRIRLRPGVDIPPPQKPLEGLVRATRHNETDKEPEPLSEPPRTFHGFAVETPADAVIEIPTFELIDEKTFEVEPVAEPEPAPMPEPAREYPPVPEATPEQIRAAVMPYACRPCGVYVTDRAVHEEFHRTHQLVTDPETVTEPQPVGPPRDEAAVFSEQDVREIVAQEVGRALDRFQAGMQTWLGERFAGVERRLGPVRHAKPKKPGQRDP